MQVGGDSRVIQGQCSSSTSLIISERVVLQGGIQTRCFTRSANSRTIDSSRSRQQRKSVMTARITRRYGIAEGPEVCGEKGPTSSGSPTQSAAFAAIQGHELQPNRGIPINLDWIEEVRVNTRAVERRAQTLVTRRTVKKEWQIAWLLRAITCMDLTTLAGDDTDERVRRLCAKAKQPVQQELVKLLGIESLGIKVAAVCVYHSFVETALRALEGSGIRVAAVSTGFPAGLSPLDER